MKKVILIMLLMITIPVVMYSQNGLEGSIQVVQDPRIDSLVGIHISMNKTKLQNPDNYDIEGYRVQIFFESGNHSSTRAREVMENFELEYPDVPAYLSWQAPNFRVRVGDFRTRMKAEAFLQRIMKDYPNAWVIKDEIKFPSLK